ncbi:MAG: trypsin-like peptidase domain-containing protein [Lachnospiraceae bacterium]|nr:trypsin-like peptidase domain-containing protein [Lachnospiraceae bacterium]
MKQKKKIYKIILFLLCACLAGNLFLVILIAPKYLEKLHSEKENIDSLLDESSQIIEKEALNTETTLVDCSSLAKKVMPSMVMIECEASVVQYDFFGFPVESSKKSSASGFIVNSDGEYIFIVTNYHVVENCKEIKAIFFTDEYVKAQVQGTSKSNDLAVIKVLSSDISEETYSKLRVAVIGSSEELKMGELVVAVGNALGIGQSITAGYISALQRSIPFENEYELEVIQTDAPINPGNSGGVLLNARGQVIGINESKIADVEVEGIGYAIPIDVAKPIVEEIMNRVTLKTEEKAYLGIKGTTVSEADSVLYSWPRGVYIKVVQKDSPAEQAGLLPGDIIIEINECRVLATEELLAILDYTKGGSEGTIKLKRLNHGEYEELEIKVVFGNQSPKKIK